MQLAIDTSTDMASLAIVEKDQLLAEITWRCVQSHTTELLPQLSHLLAQAKTSIRSISAVFVARGPGGYTGLRVGITTAKMLAFSLGIPIVSIGTLEAEAYPHAETGLPICAISNAGRGEIAVAKYLNKDGWRQLVPEHITTLEALISETNTRTIFCGEFISGIAAQLEERLGDKAVIPEPAARIRRAFFLARLGQKQLELGNVDNPATLQPLYLRRPPITVPKQRMEAKQW